jgi:hypothetical protein
MTEERAGIKSLSANYRFLGVVESSEVYYPDDHIYECLNCKEQYDSHPKKYCHECGVRFRGDPKSFRPCSIPRWAWDRNIKDYEPPERETPERKAWVIRKYDRDCPDAPPKVLECHEVEPSEDYENTIYQDGNEIPRKYSGKIIIMKNVLRRVRELRSVEQCGDYLGNGEWETVYDKLDVVLAIPPSGASLHSYLQDQLTDEEMEERGPSLENND